LDQIICWNYVVGWIILCAMYILYILDNILYNLLLQHPFY